MTNCYFVFIYQLLYLVQHRSGHQNVNL